MSSRHFRKLVGKPSIPTPPDGSDEEYEPLYAQSSGVSKYAGLEVSSQSEPDVSPEQSEEEVDDFAKALPTSNTNKKKKKKSKGKKQKPQEMDEIDRSVQEVNAILGAPSPAPSPKPEKVNQALCVLALDPKHLNVANELRRLFGPDEPETTRRARPKPNRILLLKRVLVHPYKETPVYPFNNSGLSMSKYQDINQRMYFVFNHDENYQKMHRKFLDTYISTEHNEILMYLDSARKNMHVEALLEIADRLFRMEEYGTANEIIENVVTFLQYVAHPLFIISQNNVRLDYKFMENRVFHVAMLKYAYLLSNKACHRTALEIVKMMLLLDPKDPLALLSLLDILALRAREHEWLIEAIKYFNRQRDAGLLYNIKYSNALAHFHVATKNKRDLDEADRIIQDAILAYPQVFTKILEFCSKADPVLTGHEIFKKGSRQYGSPGVEELFMIYAKMTNSRWNEPRVMNWLQRNAKELCEKFDKNKAVRETFQKWILCRDGLFQVWPPEYLRHMSVLSSMDTLVVDAPLSSFLRITCAWDPVFHSSVNRYKYRYYMKNPHSNDIRNDYLTMLNQISAFPHMAPFTPFTPADIKAIVIAQRGERHNTDPAGTFTRAFLPRMYNIMDFLFSDCDSDFKNYDYDDDEENFAIYDKDVDDLIKGELSWYEDSSEEYDLSVLYESSDDSDFSDEIYEVS